MSLKWPDLTFVQLNFSTNKTGGWHRLPWPCFEDLKEKDQWLNEQGQCNQCQTPWVKFESESKSLRITKKKKNLIQGTPKKNKEGTVIMGRKKQKQGETGRKWKKQEE